MGGFPVKDCQQKEKIVKRPYDAMLLAKSESTEDLSLIRDPHRCQAWQRHIRISGKSKNSTATDRPRRSIVVG